MHNTSERRAGVGSCIFERESIRLTAVFPQCHKRKQESVVIPRGQSLLQMQSYPKQDIVILKIDTEGHEPQILQGARNLLQDNIVHNVLMEYRTSCRDAVFEILLQNGYVLVYDEPSTNRPRTMLSQEQSKTVIDRIHQTWEKSNAKEDAYEDLWFRLASHRLPTSTKASIGGIRTAKT